MSEIDVLKAIQELDVILHQMGRSYELFTCGGAALIYLGYESRRTGDIDIIEDVLDEKLKTAVAHVAIKLRISDTWLNNTVSPLGKRLGKNWKSKCTVIFKGNAITLKCISRQDLINSKLHATVDRRSKDYHDILWLKPTPTELELAKKYTLKQNETENYVIWVNGYVSELKKDLGYE
jgi:hypothetical protein